jgi:hypothetical protein
MLKDGDCVGCGVTGIIDGIDGIPIGASEVMLRLCGLGLGGFADALGGLCTGALGGLCGGFGPICNLLLP